MADIDDKPTCVHPDPHDEGDRYSIRDYLSHFLGCVEFKDRLDLFAIGGKLWKEELKREKRRAPAGPLEKLENTITAKMHREIESCIDELMRIDILRATLKESPDHSHMVSQLEESRRKWEHSEEYQDCLPKVKAWSKRGNVKSPTAKQLRDVALSLCEETHHPSRTHTKQLKEMAAGPYHSENDIKAYVIQWDHGREGLLPFDDTEFKAKFPDQKLSLDRILRDDSLTDSSLDKEQEEQFNAPSPTSPASPDSSTSTRKKHYSLYTNDRYEKLRYFHFPANNMIWVERAIANYYNELTPDFQISHPNEGGKARHSHMILRPQYWRGQQHGSIGSKVHMRHLRPLCKAVSSDRNEAENSQNITLFMPYLHWETSRQYNQFTHWIETTTRKFDDRKSEKDTSNKTMRQGRRKDLPKPEWMKELNKTPTRKEKKSWKFVLSKLGLPKRKTNTPTLDQKRNGVVCHHSLGQYLLDAARLYESMANYRDKQLMAEYLHADPPLHPRRSLDQAYYGSLENTEYRDGDQVVYRATRATAGSFHQYDPKTKTWKGHEGRDPSQGCEDCRTNIRKVSKIVMVDQLWMWILDANTVLTFFPRRYGTNKHDISGVHKAIRTRLKTAPENRIRSAFDLGLLIIEECSGTFFDRTRNPDPKQPPVIDLFAESIADVASRHTDASLQLWKWMEHVKTWYKGNIKPSVNVLLDINAEGKLQREVKDIIEEIDIMLYITRNQKEVLMSYIAQVEEILNPNGEYGSRATTWTVDEDTQVTEFQNASPGAEGKRPWRADKTGQSKSKLPPHIKNRGIFRAFMKNATELSTKISSHVEELDQLRISAQATAESIKDLLALKQQQASALQSWQSSKDAEVTVNQGRSIMMFTVITIIFAPLSFMCAVFSMQNELSSSWTFDFQIKLIFIISFCIAILAVLLAFNRWIRGLFPFNSIVYSPVVFGSTFLLLNVPWPRYSFYVLWLRLNEYSRNITEYVEYAAENMRARVIHQELERNKKREETLKGIRDKRMGKGGLHHTQEKIENECPPARRHWPWPSRNRQKRYMNGRANEHTNGAGNGHVNRHSNGEADMNGFHV